MFSFPFPLLSWRAVEISGSRAHSCFCLYMARLHIATRLPSPQLVQVGFDCYAAIWSANISQHGGRHIPFSIAIAGAGAHIDHQTIKIVGLHMPRSAQLRWCDAAFAVRLAVWIGKRSMTGDTALLAMPVVRGAVIVIFVLTSHTFMAGPCLNQLIQKYSSHCISCVTESPFWLGTSSTHRPHGRHF